jgi:hypothetical protein
MSRRVPLDQARPGDVLMLNVRDSAQATRYALPRARRRPTMELQSSVGHPHDQRLFILHLPPESVRKLAAELAEANVPCEVWR